MRIDFIASTVGGFERKTRIAFCRDDGAVEIKEYPGDQLPAILQLAADEIDASNRGDTLRSHSKQNTFRDAFALGWFKDWKARDFKGKTPTHKAEWRKLDEVMIARNVEIEVCDLDKQAERKLGQALANHDRGWTPREPAPGDPHEEPWASPERIHDIIDRKMKKRDS